MWAFSDLYFPVYGQNRMRFVTPLNLVTPLSIFAFWYEGKTRMKAIWYEGYLCVYPAYKKVKMLWERDFLTPCRNPRRKNTAQMDFFREENRLTLKPTPSFELTFVYIFGISAFNFFI